VRPRRERPLKESRRVLVVLLRVAAPVQVQDDAARAVGDPPVIGEREPEVRLSDSGGAVHDGERAGPQAAVEHRIELGNAGRDARGHGRRFYTERPLVANCRS
jgi:hypothetical protein